tara:strand:+ start:111 stop:788 length:678 start_codon:yes stop_codon:yes gene_type:complete
MATITDFINQQNLKNSLDRQLNNQPEYIPTGQGLEIGSFGITPELLRGTGLQVGSMGISPILLTDASLQIGSMGVPYSRRLNTGTPSVYRPETLPALSDLGGITPSFNVANEEDEEQDEFLGSEPNKFQEGIAKLFEFFQRFSPVAAIGRGIESLRNRRDVREAIKKDILRDTQGGPITTFRNVKQQAQDIIDDRGRGQIPTRTTSAPKRPSSNAYSDAKKAFRS